MMELLPYHKYRCKTEHKHHQQIIQKITRVDTEPKNSYKNYNRLHWRFTLMQFSFSEQIYQRNLHLFFRAFVKLHNRLMEEKGTYSYSKRVYILIYFVILQK